MEAAFILVRIFFLVFISLFIIISLAYSVDKMQSKPTYISIILNLMCDIVIADKNKMACELDVIKLFIRQNDPKKYKSHLNSVKSILKTGGTTYDQKTEYCKILHNKYSLSEREKILDYLFLVAYADGDCSIAEIASLRIFITHIFSDLSREQREKLYAIYRDKYEAKKSENQSHWKSSNRSNNTNNSQYSNGYNSQSYKPSLSAELRKAYAALGIPEDATESQIRARWRNLMRVNHPDSMVSRGAAAVESATIKCQELNMSFEKIKASRGMK